MTVSLIVLLFSAIGFGALDLVFNDSSDTRRVCDNTVFHNYYGESHGRMLLAFNHDKQDKDGVGKDSIIRVDLRMTAWNADDSGSGSGHGKNALAHWTSNQNSDQSGNDYSEATEMQKGHDR